MHSGMMLAASGAAISLSSKLALAETVTLPFGNGERPLIKYPQKRPLIGLTSRPPQLETPFSVFNEGVITPNDAFFVRYHLADIPLEIDPDTFSVEIKGKVDKPLKLSLAEIKNMPAIELVAVNQCSGNSRGFLIRASGVVNSPTVPWATHAGRAFLLRRSSTKPACRLVPSRSCSARSMVRSATGRRILPRRSTSIMRETAM